MNFGPIKTKKMDYDDYQELQRLRRATKIFDGTILDGLPEIEEENFIDSDIEVEKDDQVIGELDDLEKRIHTLIAFAWGKACEIAPDLMLDDEIDFLIGCCYEENVDEIVSLKEDLVERYLAQGASFLEENWIKLVLISDRAGHIMRIFNGVLMSHFPKEKFKTFVIKKGFTIVLGEDENYLITSFDFPAISPN